MSKSLPLDWQQQRRRGVRRTVVVVTAVALVIYGVALGQSLGWW